jgi:hypothetical protein
VISGLAPSVACSPPGNGCSHGMRLVHRLSGYTSTSRFDETDSVIGETLLVAVLTGGTAVLASWVTSRGNARTARVQAEAAAG